MDRTGEFRSVVDTTGVPQVVLGASPPFGGLAAAWVQISGTLAKLEKFTDYEAYRLAPELNKAYRAVEDYRAMEIPEAAPGDAAEVRNNLRTMVENNAMRATLRLNALERRCRKTKETKAALAAEEAHAPRHPSQATASRAEVAYASPASSYRSEVEEAQRRRISHSVNEIGQMVQDISMHVRLQEEQLIRIDTALTETDHWTKQTLGEINLMWEAAAENRPFMYKFFIFWGVVFVLFICIKKA